MTDSEIEETERIAKERFGSRKTVPNRGIRLSNPPMKIAGHIFDIPLTKRPKSTSNYYINPTPLRETNQEPKISKIELKAIIKSKLDEIKGKK